MLREPTLAYGPAALAILYAVGLLAIMAAMAGFAQMDVSAASGLATPVAAATIATALAVGTRLRRYVIKTRVSFVLQVAGVWAIFGAAWPMIHSVSDTLLQSSPLGASDALIMGAGAVIGAIGGAVGAAAAMVLCLEGGRR
jgi:hypothetical protein